MNLFNNVVNKDIDFLMSQVGRVILIGSESTIGVISSKALNYFDDRYILVKDLIRIGDIVQDSNKKYIIWSQVNDKKFGCYYRGILRRCNYLLNVAIAEDNKQVVKRYDVFVSNRVFEDTIGQTPIPLSQDQREVCITADGFTWQLKKQDRIIMCGRVWEVKGVDNTLGTMLKILVEEALINENDNLDKEIADYWKYNVRYTAITINNPLPIQIKEGQSIKLDVTTIPIGGTVEFSVSDNSIAVVNEDGTITGLKAGQTNIISVIKDTDIIASVDIEIVAVPQYTDIVIQNNSPMNLNVGQIIRLTAVTTPNGGEIEYVSSDDLVATVNSSGLITAVASGNATISVAIKDSSILKAIDINVDFEIQQSILLSSPKDYIETFGTLQITATTTPLDAKVTFMFEGAQNKCKFINVTDNRCTIKADSDVGFITIKAFLKDNINVIGSKRITIKNDW